MSIADVIGWKFNYQEGMRCEEIDGVMVITDFPGGLPSDADQATWTAEYIAAEPWKDDQAEAELGTDTIRVIIETIVPMIQDGSISTATPGDVIAQAKANRKAEL